MSSWPFSLPVSLSLSQLLMPPASSLAQQSGLLCLWDITIAEVNGTCSPGGREPQRAESMELLGHPSFSVSPSHRSVACQSCQAPDIYRYIAVPHGPHLYNGSNGICLRDGQE